MSTFKVVILWTDALVFLLLGALLVLALIAARRDTQRMIDEGAPVGVVRAAQELIYCAANGTTPRADTQGVLLQWAALRQGQDRYGKPLM